MGEQGINDALRRKNIRVAWVLAGFVLLILISAVHSGAACSAS